MVMDFDLDAIFKFQPADPRKLIIGVEGDDRHAKSRAKLERRFINRMFVKNKRTQDYNQFVRSCRDKYGETMPTCIRFLEQYPQFPIHLFPGIYRWIFQWNGWDLLSGDKLRNSQLFEEFENVYREINEDPFGRYEKRDVGIVFKVVKHGIFVLHDWSNSEYLKNSSHPRLTFPVTMGTDDVTTYLEPLDSLIEDLGDSWYQ